VAITKSNLVSEKFLDPLTLPAVSVAETAHNVPLQESVNLKVSNATSEKISEKILKRNTEQVSVRLSLRASTIDGGLAAVFNSITTGVLLNNFLLDLGASAVQIGLISSLPMLANLLQPLGALLSNRTESRHFYGLKTFLPARMLWLSLLLVIIFNPNNSLLLISLTIILVFFSNIMGALGSASWMSWLAALVPAQLRGRYYSVRHLVANLVGLVCLPVASLIVSWWQGGAIAGYGIVLSIGIMAGILSLSCQEFMIDVNPQIHKAEDYSFLKDLNATFSDRNLRLFLIYCALWGFSIHLSAPYFNLYMLDNLNLDITWVTLFNTLYTGANMLMLLVWGRLSDRFGNRPLLIFVGIAISTAPIFWLIPSAIPQTYLILYLAIFHFVWGGTWGAIDLATNNIQIGIAPLAQRATFFAIAAAIVGVFSALGTTTGGFFAQSSYYTGWSGIFFLSAIARLVSLLPLLFVIEKK
jgi:MFS family permease